ncbi:MAG TPA: ATP-binding cassette domain-containing protein [Firmicutes bacterium]|nr:ATP-binding cassette domain-containing protein [Bacillota bacterium]
MIRIEQVTKVFETKGGQVRALKNVSLHVPPGEICGIIGMSGAGKSTLLRCMALLEQPTEGTVAIDGVRCDRLNKHQRLQLQRRIGIVFQGYNLLAQRTIARNVALPLELARTPKKQIQEKVAQLLDTVGLLDKAEAYPAQLSGGQRQRVAIARALAAGPKVLLCDEPTSALDRLTTQAVLELLQRINREYGVTIVIITHEIGVVRAICSQVAVIDEGVFAESGATEQVFSAPQNQITRQLLGEGV